MAPPYTVVSTTGAPAAIGPYVQALKHNGLVYASGSIALHPDGKGVVGTDIEAQTTQVFENISAVLAASGSDKSHVLKTTVFLSDMADFQGMNKIYAGFFGEHVPARSCFQVAKLPLNVLVEIEFIAAVVSE